MIFNNKTYVKNIPARSMNVKSLLALRFSALQDIKQLFLHCDRLGGLP